MVSSDLAGRERVGLFRDNKEVFGRLADLSKELLLVWGAQDSVTPYSAATAKMFPGAEQIVFPGCGHMLLMEAAPSIFREVVDFLERRQLSISTGNNQSLPPSSTVSSESHSALSCFVSDDYDFRVKKRVAEINQGCWRT